MAACNDPEIVRSTSIPSPYKRADAEAFLATSREGLANGDAFSLVVVNALTDELVGTILLVIAGQGVGEVGYWTSPEARGSGYASRATRLISEWGIRSRGLERIHLLTFPDNVASGRVAEKAGFVREGVLRSYRAIRGERRDLVSFSLLPSDLGE